MDEWVRKFAIHTVKYLESKKKSNPVVCSKMNKTAKYDGKWNNTGRELQMSHVLPPKISKKSWN